MQLKDKVAIVTGSSRGIGKAIAERFAREGAKVVVNYVRNKKAADAVVAGIRKAKGEAVAVKADVSKRADADRLIKAAIKSFGRLDILVSNAGIVIDRPFIESTQIRRISRDHGPDRPGQAAVARPRNLFPPLAYLASE